MATKTFEELKQMAIQIRDEKTNKQNTATRIGTQMLEHLNKLEQDFLDKDTTEGKFSELENNIAGCDDWKEGFFYPKVSIGSTFTGATTSNGTWKIVSTSKIPPKSIIQLHNISYGAATQAAIVCDMYDKVIDIVNSESNGIGIIEKTYDEPVNIYVSTQISNANSKVIIYDKDRKYELKNKFMDYSSFPFIKRYYSSKNWEVGQIFNPIPSSKNDDYNSFQEFVFIVGKGTAHVFYETLYQLYKLNYVRKDSMPKFVIRNRVGIATVAFALGFGSAILPPSSEEIQASIQEAIEEFSVHRIYEVKEGDSLESISANTHVSEELLLQENSSSSFTSSGESIIIPYKISEEQLDSYTKTQDFSQDLSLEEYAKSYQTDIATLVSLNRDAVLNVKDQYVVLSDTLTVPDFTAINHGMAKSYTKTANRL